MSSLTYRLARLDEKESVIRLFREAVAKMRSDGNTQWDDEYPSDRLIELDIETGFLTVVEFDGQLVAVYTVYPCGADRLYGKWKYERDKHASLCRLCVHPFFQGKGVGTAVLKHIEDELIADGTEVFRLDAYVGNPAAIKMYESAGFEKTHILTGRTGDFQYFEKLLNQGGNLK